MKNALLFLFFLTCFYSAKGQNYQCLQPTVKHFFINSNNYLRGIRVDSVKTYTDSIVYFPFHTPRGPYDEFTMPALDSNGGSWLGKKVIQLTDGTTIFDSYWGDSVIIKTQANVGDSWIFYNDSGSVYYKATVIGKDTMTVLSSLDSVKQIRINTFNASGAVTSDSLDNLMITLSKAHGFVQVFDLYTFPYHKPDSTYRPGLDFFLDHVCGGPFSIHFNRSNLIFFLVDFINPNDQQLHNWGVGEILESRLECGDIYVFGSYSAMRLVLDTITSKTVIGHAANYVLAGSSGYISCPSFAYPTTINTAGFYSFYDTLYSILGPTEMPEEKRNKRDIFYYANDTNFCFTAPLYVIKPIQYTDGLGSFYSSITYKFGLGLTSDWYADGNPSFAHADLIYHNTNGVSCGTLIPAKIADAPIVLPVSILPNPANNELTIKTGISSNYTVILQNPLGQTIKHLQVSRPEETINVSELPAGIYFVNIIDKDGNRSSAKVLIAH